MLEMEQDHKKKTDDLNKDLNDETMTHEEKVAKIQALIDQENSYGKNARQSKLDQYKQELADETESYNKKVADIQTKLDEENQSYAESVQKKTEQNALETQDLVQQHQERVNDYQTQLNAEQTILNNHQAEVNAVKDKARVDDITRLMQQHAEENAEAERQHIQKMADIKAQNSAEGAAGAKAFNDEWAKGLEKMKKDSEQDGRDAAKSLVDNLGQGGMDSGTKMVLNFVKGIVDAAHSTVGKIVRQGVSMTNPMLGALNEIAKLVGFADGVRNFEGGMAIVGERGPELVNLPKGSDVYSNEEMKGMGQTIIVNVDHLDSRQDVEALAREIGFKISQLPR